jgi:uncharacterized membrane protein
MTRKQVGLTLIAVVVLAALVFFLPRLFVRDADLRSCLASALNLPKDRAADFFINLPPVASRYPGTILATEKLFILNPADANDTFSRDWRHNVCRFLNLFHCVARPGTALNFMRVSAIVTR